MKYRELLKELEDVLKEKREDRFFLTYNSLIEEALKIALRASKSDKPLIVVKENSYMASRLKDILVSYFDEEEIVTYLPESSLRSEEIATSFENRADRLFALYRIITEEKIKVIITSPYGYIRHLPEKEVLRDSLIRLRKDDNCSRDELISSLRKLGYEKTAHVETPMTYAARGYIVDLYSVNYDRPVRIEFFDDYIDSIRFFDINTQRTLEMLEEVTISFAKDVFFNDEEKQYLKDNVEVLSGEMELDLEYIYNDQFAQSQYFYYAFFKKAHLNDYIDAYTYLSDEYRIKDHLKMLNEETVSYIQEMHEEKKLPLRFYVYADFDRQLKGQDIIKGEAFREAVSAISEVDLPFGNIDYLINLIDKEKSRYKLIVLQGREAEDTVNALTRFNMPYSVFTGKIKEGINIVHGYMYGGFAVGSKDLIVYTTAELFKQRKHHGRFASKYAEARSLNSYEELNRGDYVVHDQYGIGQYVSIETRTVNGISLDYLRIIYKGNDELLVPLSQFSLVRKYVSKEGVVPKLNKLGSKDWEKTRKRVEESVDELAERLIELYANRNEEIGHAFSKDSDMQREFEEGFTYELTDDQELAIREVKEDMESKRPMDRLLCGDVGFGKTEVALRAAFKAVNDDKQVAYLCPTTILSLQHYNTFKSRLDDFPCRVELLNRFVSDRKQKEIIEDLKAGKVDILIGTHRILSGDIKFKDLGLLIIDEEQRLGVEHKEMIREMKQSIDVLSLSATPIPRTLQMSLIGIRSLSNLDTPPQNRYPVQTYVVHKNENLVREVIMRELERNGQVFYLYNNVERIYNVANKIAKDIPYARVEVAHGKMSAEAIEDVMLRFYNNEINVLVCTTIVETGIDIPNANTIIVDDAQNFGLAQLYQIKGRVGRSDRVAYAYLLIPENKQLKETSIKRLEAIK
ncbi:MAG: transcription-repair coupling factor, partial [Erysipelotrichaceae bacterium]|nr:transcription-repair coupling factor [Erysipelotrichaceae bacterium]